TSATSGAPGSIVGTLDSSAGSFRVEVFKNVTCDASAHGEGATYLGSVVTSDGSFNLAAAVDAGDIVTATATAPDGSTSEFSGCSTVTEPPTDGPSWTVNTSDDHDDSACTLLDCTLREAINRANDETGTDTISFAIAGAGVHTITPATALPVITDPVVIDGST